MSEGTVTPAARTVLSAKAARKTVAPAIEGLNLARSTAAEARRRIDEIENLIQSYRADVADAHPTAPRALLDEMGTIFCGALLLRMEQLTDGVEDDADDAAPCGEPQERTRVVGALRRCLDMVERPMVS